jgi:predicted amidophosphoribosyltransferase
LNATSKIKKTFEGENCVDKLFYYDFYSIEIFGKTKIGQKLLYAKQSQDRKLILEISEEILSAINNLIKKEKIDSVVFVPPTVPRKIQFMTVLESNLKLKLPKIKVKKIIADIRVPQKTLKKLKDRVENAEETFFVNDDVSFKKTLIIDDAVGSGASINQIACKLKENKNSKKVVGSSIVGSLNDFEVVSEV